MKSQTEFSFVYPLERRFTDFIHAILETGDFPDSLQVLVTF